MPRCFLGLQGRIYQMVLMTLNHASLVRDVQQPSNTKGALCASPAGISCGTGWYPRQADQDVALLQPIIIPCDFYNFRLGISKMLKACCSCGHKCSCGHPASRKASVRRGVCDDSQGLGVSLLVLPGVLLDLVR